MDRSGPKTKEDFKESLVFQRDLAEMLGQEVKTLQARVKEAEKNSYTYLSTIASQGHLIEEMEAELSELKSCPNESWECAKEQRRLEAEKARLQKLVDMNQRVVEAARGLVYLKANAAEFEQALRELDGDKCAKCGLDRTSIGHDLSKEPFECHNK